MCARCISVVDKRPSRLAVPPLISAILLRGSPHCQDTTPSSVPSTRFPLLFAMSLTPLIAGASTALRQSRFIMERVRGPVATQARSDAYARFVSSTASNLDRERLEEETQVWKEMKSQSVEKQTLEEDEGQSGKGTSCASGADRISQHDDPEPTYSSPICYAHLFPSSGGDMGLRPAGSNSEQIVAGERSSVDPLKNRKQHRQEQAESTAANPSEVKQKAPSLSDMGDSPDLQSVGP